MAIWGVGGLGGKDSNFLAMTAREGSLSHLHEAVGYMTDPDRQLNYIE